MTEEQRNEQGAQIDEEDIFLDPQENVSDEQTASEEHTPEELGRLLEDARNKADEHWDLVMRNQAELENIKRRHQRELENAHKFGLDKFVGELLGVWDSLELGHQASLDESADVAKLREGTELTLKMLISVMNNFGVEQIDPKGQPFDPEKHQAMAMEPSAEVEPNTVVDVLQKGYSLNGRLVRPAMVRVSQ
ncbi:MAG: nucleotide exchange factor GrpE [bacterium]